MAISKGDNPGLFKPESQEEFWNKITPNIQHLLEFFEGRETWTIPYDEMPEFYDSLEGIIVDLQKTPDTGPSEDLLDRMILVFGAIPLRQCIAGLSYIDRNIDDSSSIQWAGGLFFKALDISLEGNTEDDLVKNAIILKERIELVVRMNILSSLFSHLKI